MPVVVATGHPADRYCVSTNATGLTKSTAVLHPGASLPSINKQPGRVDAGVISPMFSSGILFEYLHEDANLSEPELMSKTGQLAVFPKPRLLHSSITCCSLPDCQPIMKSACKLQPY